MIDVVAAIIKKNDKILIARRKNGISLGGYWEFPGGKIEEGEKPEESLVRELKEEMMIDISISSYFGENVHHYSDKVIRLIAYFAEILCGQIVLKDHDSYEWITTSELGQYTFAPADVPFVDKLKTLSIE